MDRTYKRDGRVSNAAGRRGRDVIRIAIADDHPLMRDALASAIGSAVSGAQFVEAGTLETTLALVAQTPAPDLLLMDLHMPGADGLSGVQAIRTRSPHVPVAVVSADDDPVAVRALLALGVAGFIPKTESPAVIASAVRLILAGGVYVPPRLMDRGSSDSRAAEAPSGLTGRQMDVVRLLARGLSNKAIARELNVSEGTVKVHLLAVFRALDVRNRTSAVLAAQRFLD